MKLHAAAWVALSLFVSGCSGSPTGEGGRGGGDGGDGGGNGGGGDGGTGSIAGAGGFAGAGGGLAGTGGSGTGGASGSAGGAGGSPAGGSGGGTGAVRIIRGDPNESTWFTLTIEGRGFASEEGKLVMARIGHPQRPPERLGSAQARIEGGAFRIEFPQGCEGFLYKQKFLFIDVDADGSCTPSVDLVYSDARFLDKDMTLTLSDSVPAAPPNTQMRRTDRPASSDCEALNQPWPDS